MFLSITPLPKRACASVVSLVVFLAILLVTADVRAVTASVPNTHDSLKVFLYKLLSKVAYHVIAAFEKAVIDEVRHG